VGRARRRSHQDRPAHRIDEEYSFVQSVRLDARLHGSARTTVRRQHRANSEPLGVSRWRLRERLFGPGKVKGTYRRMVDLPYHKTTSAVDADRSPDARW